MICVKSRSFHFRRLRFVVLALATVLVAGRSAFASPPVVAVVGDRLVIQGVRPGASVALLGAAHEPAYYMSRIVSRRELLTDDDGDGKIEYKPPNGIAFQSIWIVADLTTGEATVTSPAGYRPIPMTQQGAGRGNAVNVVGNGVDIGRDHADILVVRPNQGAWAIPVREGRGADTAPIKGRVGVPLPTLHPLRANFGDAPPALKPGDVIAIVDAVRMEYWVTTIGGAK